MKSILKSPIKSRSVLLPFIKVNIQFELWGFANTGRELKRSETLILNLE